MKTALTSIKEKPLKLTMKGKADPDLEEHRNKTLMNKPFKQPLHFIPITNQWSKCNLMCQHDFYCTYSSINRVTGRHTSRSSPSWFDSWLIMAGTLSNCLWLSNKFDTACDAGWLEWLVYYCSLVCEKWWMFFFTFFL